jgi:hypothetical protein
MDILFVVLDAYVDGSILIELRFNIMTHLTIIYSFKKRI